MSTHLRLKSLIILMLLTATAGWAQPTNYPIIPAWWCNLAGYDGHDDNEMANMWDGYPFIDPKNGVTTYSTSPGLPGYNWDNTQWQPVQLYGVYFPKGRNAAPGGPLGPLYRGNRGARLWLDFVGTKNLYDTSRRITLTDIYHLNVNFDIGNIAKLYDMDFLAGLPPGDQLKYLRRPDSLCTPFATLTTNNHIKEWRFTTTSVSLRYMLIVIGIDDGDGIYGTTTNGKTFESGELVFYGQYGYSPAAIPADSLIKQEASTASWTNNSPLKTIKKKNGHDMQEGVDSLQLGNMGSWYRYFYGRDYNDKQITEQTTAYEYFNAADIDEHLWGYHKRHGDIAYLTLQASSAFVNGQSSGQNQLGVDNNDYDPEDDSSYRQSQKYMFNVVALMGSVAVSSGLTQWTGLPGGFHNGMGFFQYFGGGNENDGHGATPMAGAAKARMDFIGLKNADPSARYIRNEMVTYDSNQVKVDWMTLQWNSPGDSLQYDYGYHYYPSNKDFGKGITYPWPRADSMQSATAEWVGFRPRMTKFIQRIKPYMSSTAKIVLGEWGQDMMGQYGMITDNSHVGVRGNYVSPSTTGLDSLQRVAVDAAHFIFQAASVSGLDAFIHFALENYLSDSTINHIGNFFNFGAASGRQISPPYHMFKLYPKYNVMAFYNRVAGDYYITDTVSVVGADSSGTWKLLARKFGQPDSVCLVVYKGGHEGDSLLSQAITMPVPVKGNIKMRQSLFTDTVGIAKDITPTAGVITENVTNMPKLYFFLQDSGPIIGPRIIKQRNRFIINKH